MDNEVSAKEAPPTSEPTTMSLPKGAAFPSAVTPASVAPVPEPDERTGVFRQLVKDDSDIAGLVAYSIYKQNKLDWLTAFEKSKGRVPNTDELGSYIIGEGTPRRIATYRHLAEATLAGNGPEVTGSGAAAARPTPRRPGGALAERRGLTPGIIAAYAALAMLLVFGFIIAAHYTVSSR